MYIDDDIYICGHMKMYVHTCVYTYMWIHLHVCAHILECRRSDLEAEVQLEPIKYVPSSTVGWPWLPDGVEGKFHLNSQKKRDGSNKVADWSLVCQPGAIDAQRTIHVSMC